MRKTPKPPGERPFMLWMRNGVWYCLESNGLGYDLHQLKKHKLRRDWFGLPESVLEKGNYLPGDLVSPLLCKLRGYPADTVRWLAPLPPRPDPPIPSYSSTNPSPSHPYRIWDNGSYSERR